MYEHEPAPPIREYSLIKRDRLAGTTYVLATPDGKPITHKVKKPPVPGFAEDPRANTRVVPVLSIDVMDKWGDSYVLDYISQELNRSIDHNAEVWATVRGKKRAWTIADSDK